MARRRRAAVLAVTGLGLTAIVGLPAAGAQAVGAGGPCGTLGYDSAAPPTYDHVVLIMDENLSFKAYTTSSQATFLHGLGAACGTEQNMHAATHSSHPNYMAVSSGVPSQSGHIAADNVFHQADGEGDGWRTYVESMPANCSSAKSTAPLYKTGHNAAFWYTDLAGSSTSCRTNDLSSVPALDAAITDDALPRFSWIVPNLCNDMHGSTACTTPTSQRVAQGDTWMSTWISKLTAMPSYQAGRTLIVITWDEGSGSATVGVDCTSPAYYPSHPDCQIPTIVVSPYVVPGASDATDHNLYGLLGTIEDLLGYPRLNAAVGQSSLRPGLGF